VPCARERRRAAGQHLTEGCSYLPGTQVAAKVGGQQFINTCMVAKYQELEVLKMEEGSNARWFASVPCCRLKAEIDRQGASPGLRLLDEMMGILDPGSEGGMQHTPGSLTGGTVLVRVRAAGGCGGGGRPQGRSGRLEDSVLLSSIGR